jgi:hypothetical protein
VTFGDAAKMSIGTWLTVPSRNGEKREFIVPPVIV